MACLRRWLDLDFGDLAEELFPLCVSPHSGRPMYLSHLPIVIETLGADHLDDTQLDELNAAYLYLTCSYYCIDALADGHPHIADSSSVRQVSTALPIFLNAASRRIVKATCGRAPADCITLLSFAHEALVELRTAVQLENVRCASPDVPFDPVEEFDHLAGRSSSIIFLFRSVSHLACINLDSALLLCVRSILVAIQHRDDISDWRVDLNLGKWTPFLRQCASLGAKTLFDFEQLILTDGQFEVALGNVVRMLSQSLRYLPTDYYSEKPLKLYVDEQIHQARTELQGFILSKLRAGMAYERTVI